MATQKKSPIASERDEEKRGLWRWLAFRFDAGRLVFVDECGTHTSMARLRSRAPKGERAYGRVPRNRGKNQTLIAAITLEGAMGQRAALSIEGATDARVFECYVEHFLAPTLTEGQVVVMDKLSAHRTERARELMEARGAELVFLPSYSPDLNPIEEAFSKIKGLLRKAGARAKPWSKRWRRRSVRSWPKTLQVGLGTVATTLRLNTCEDRYTPALSDGIARPASQVFGGRPGGPRRITPAFAQGVRPLEHFFAEFCLFRPIALPHRLGERLDRSRHVCIRKVRDATRSER